jgi:hypothetical protein
MNRKGFGRKSPSPDIGTILNFSSKTEENHESKIADVLAKNRTEDLPNMNQERYRYVSPLVALVSVRG